jgi:hypothetical protein
VRVSGLAGAYTGYAEGIEGVTSNAAAPGVRVPYSFRWIDWDADIDVALPGAYQGTDFDNRGQNADPRLVSTINGFFYAHAGLNIQLGEVGAAVTGELLQYDVNPNSGGPGLALTYGRWHALVAYGLFGNQLVVGAGARIVTLDLSEKSSSITGGRTLVTMNGAAPEVGVVIKPDNFPLRIGATLRAPVSGTGSGAGTTSVDAEGVRRAGEFVLPSSVTQPWELETGFALQLGPRPLNAPWLNPHEMERTVRDRIASDRARRKRENAAAVIAVPPADRDLMRRVLAQEEEALRAIEDQRLAAESRRMYAIRSAREKNWPRERITLVASLLLTGPSSDAVALEGFITQHRELVGQSTSLAPHFGLESEPIINWVHGRVGSYLEPSRFSDGYSRQHFTFGGEVKLGQFSPWGILGEQTWRIGVSADLAPRYQNYGLSLGSWH